MQIRKTRHLAPDVLQTLLQVAIFQAPCRIKHLPRLRNRRLFGYDPGVQRSTHGTQTGHGAKRSHPPAGDTYQTQHFALEFLESHEVESVLEDAAIAAVVLWGGENDPLGRLDILAQ